MQHRELLRSREVQERLTRHDADSHGSLEAAFPYRCRPCSFLVQSARFSACRCIVVRMFTVSDSRRQDDVLYVFRPPKVVLLVAGSSLERNKNKWCCASTSCFSSSHSGGAEGGHAGCRSRTALQSLRHIRPLDSCLNECGACDCLCSSALDGHSSQHIVTSPSGH